METCFSSICLFFFVTTVFSSDAYSVSSQAAQLARLKKYEIVTPRRLDGRHSRDVTTLTESGHLSESSFTIRIDGEEHILDLFLNDVLFADGFLERTYSENHIPITSPPKKAHHCYYQGAIRGYNSSKVAISTCNGLSGVIWFNGETFYIEPLAESDQDHLVFRAENVMREKPIFTFEEHYPPHFLRDGEKRMQKMKETGGRQRRGVESEIKYIELILVADRAEFEKLGSNDAVIEKCKKVANIMDTIYQGLHNTRVALVLVEVWSTQDGFVVSTNPSQTLNLFQSWRRRNLVQKFRHDNAQLITGVNFDGSTVGMAGVGTMCSLDDSCGVSMDHGNEPGDLASTICHELGHNLGLVHDDDSCDCSGPTRVGCVMASSSGSTPPTNWSSCSVERYSKNLNTGLGACMFNYPEVIFDGPSCGNGFIEEGEECDCGSPEDCKNTCCVAETCTLHANATCAIGECCQDCQLKERGTLCRSMVNECDLPEYCTGDYEECPSNVYRQNGVMCTTQESDAASCYDGQCVSYDDQCRSIWGSGAKKSHDKCWQYNKQGDSFGNCGRDSNGALRKCSQKDRFCGKLYCQGGQSFPLIGNLATALRAVIDNVHECKAASVDQGKDVPDPGYVATGSVCGEAMICYEFSCVNYSMADIVPCKYNCHDQGICNSNNNCHCDDAWNPPFCEHPGSGGSIDSGPANANQDDGGKPKSHGLLMIILLVILIPAFVIGVIVAIWKRDIIKDKLMTARSQFGRPNTAPKGRYAPVKKPATAGYIYRPQRPPPPKPTAKSTAPSQPKTETGINKYRWPDEPAAPPSKPAPVGPAYTSNYKANSSALQPPVAVIQPKKPMTKPPPKPTNLSKPTPPSKPSPVAAQRAALKPVGARPAIPKRPVSSTGPQNNNWNNSKNVLQPSRTAPTPPKK